MTGGGGSKHIVERNVQAFCSHNAIMPTLTIRGIPETVMDRLRQHAEAERRSINQQVITILDEALPVGSRASWGEAYQTFREKWRDSLLADDEVETLFGGMKNAGKGRDSNPFD